jgi:TBC1 domain family member 14
MLTLVGAVSWAKITSTLTPARDSPGAVDKATLDRIWDTERKSSSSGKLGRYRSLLWLGPIPARFRPAVWTLALQNTLHVTAELYEVFLSHAKSSRYSTDDESGSRRTRYGQEKSMDLIPIDLPRSIIVDLDMQVVQRILEAYTCYRPDVGYVQGMTYLTGVMIAVGMSEYDAFQCLANLLHTSCLRTFYSVDVDLMRPYVLLHSRLLAEHSPLLSAHMLSIGITPDIYLYEWILTLYAAVLSSSVVFRIWDGVFLRGDKHISIVAVALIKALSAHIIGRTFEEVASLLSRGAEIAMRVDECHLFTCIQSIRISTRRYQSLLCRCQVDSIRERARRNSITTR